MADRLNCKGGIRLMLLAGGVLLSLFCRAEAVNDPTRPPMTWKENAASDTPIDTGPTLQSIIVSDGRKVAIISGQKVALGDKYGGAKIVQISETSVTLKSGKSTQVLKLFPNVKKVPAKHAKDAEKTEQPSEKY